MAGLNRCATLLVASASLCAGLSLQSGSSASAEPEKQFPVSKVVTLLKDMRDQLEKEAEQDQEIYDKLACWCQTNDREKTAAVESAEERLRTLQSKIEQYGEESARLGVEIKRLGKEVAKLQASLDKATAMRQKQLEDFTAEEKDMLESIKALKAALVILEKHHKSALLQGDDVHMEGVARALQQQLRKHASLLEGLLTMKERRAVDSFTKAPADYFDADPTFKQSYAPQSGEIFGILKEMLETFESNLATSQKEELANQKAYEELKSAKEGEIEATKAQLKSKTHELATTDEKRVQAKQDREDTEKTLSLDEKFLLMLKDKCQLTDKEWEERQSTRQEEIQAVSKAISILTTDDARALFSKTFNPSLLQGVASAPAVPTLLQRGATESSDRRSRASAILAAVARKANSPRMAAIAVRARLDAFTRVKKAIDDMVAQLLKEKDDEIKHRDFCIDEFSVNARETSREEHESSRLTEKVKDLQGTVDELGKAIEALKTEITDMEKQIKDAGEDRVAQNQEFQETVADQRESRKLLHSAVEALQSAYGKGPAFAQRAPWHYEGRAPPKDFEKYQKHQGASGVIGMLQQVISDSEHLEAQSTDSEESAQAAYEGFVKETSDSIAANERDITNKGEAKAKAEGDLLQAKSDLDATATELEQLSNYNAELHQDCDFITRNFEVRQDARDEEIRALRQAKELLSGARFEDFLQR